MQKWTVLIVLSLLIAFTHACQDTSQAGSFTPLAKVGSNTLYWEDLLLELDAFRLQSADSADYVQYQIDNWVQNQILILESERLNLASDPFVEKKLAYATQEVLIQALENSFIESIDEDFGASEIEVFYQNNPELFILKQEHIEVEIFQHPNLSVCQNARELILKGKTMKEVINSMEDSEYKVELLQTFNKLFSRSDYTEMAPEYFKNRTLSIGEVSDIYYNEGTPRFIRISGINTEGSIAPLYAIETQIRHWLVTEHRNKNLAAFKKALYLKAESNNQIEYFTTQ